jgi:hypothetical protein
MPTLIVFSSSGGSAEQGASGRRTQIKVSETPEEVVKKLGGAENGFADFAPTNKPKQKIWVNRDQVQMVRAS